MYKYQREELAQRLMEVLDAAGPIENKDQLATRLVEAVEEYVDDSGWDSSAC